LTIKSTTIREIKINLLLNYKYSQFYDQTKKIPIFNHFQMNALNTCIWCV